MQETTRQYVKRITAYVKGKDHLRVLRSTPGKLSALLRGRRSATLTRRPEKNRWSVAEILAHVAESEIVLGYRLRMVLSSNGTPIQSFDETLWQKNAAALRRNPRQTLNLFRCLREANVALLKSLSPHQWKLYGVHAERGKESIGRMVELFAGHDVNHLKQIERILGV